MANYPARNSGDQTINYLRAPVTFLIGTAGIVQVGTLPAGALVIRAYVVVGTVFNFGTNNIVKIGTVASDNVYSGNTSGSVVAVGTIPTTFTSPTAAALTPSVDTAVICTSLCTGTAGTTGQAYVVVEYAPIA